MSRQSLSLDVIDVAKPCPADWDDMRGDQQVRFCKHCSLHVYDLSQMTRAQAERLVDEREGKLCVRFYRRADGTVLTQDCGGGWRLAASRLGRRASAGAAVVLTAVLAPLGLTQWLAASPTPKETPIECTKEPVAPPQAFLGRVALVMGDIAPAKIGELAPPPPPATLPATTQPVTTQPTER